MRTTFKSGLLAVAFVGLSSGVMLLSGCSQAEKPPANAGYYDGPREPKSKGPASGGATGAAPGGKTGGAGKDL